MYTWKIRIKTSCTTKMIHFRPCSGYSLSFLRTSSINRLVLLMRLLFPTLHAHLTVNTVWQREEGCTSYANENECHNIKRVNESYSQNDASRRRHRLNNYWHHDRQRKAATCTRDMTVWRRNEMTHEQCERVLLDKMKW